MAKLLRVRIENHTIVDADNHGQQHHQSVWTGLEGGESPSSKAVGFEALDRRVIDPVHVNGLCQT